MNCETTVLFSVKRDLGPPFTTLKKALPDLINKDQTSFLKRRSIAENCRLIDGIITYAESQNVPGILLSIDVGNAFDTLEWNFSEKLFAIITLAIP